MSKASIDHPGIREQHLLRKQGNPLFDEDQRTVSSDDIADARLRDGIEKDRFQEVFNTLVGKAADLEPNAPSETVLEIKEELDQSYQQACALPGNQEPIKSAIRKLVAVIMQAVWNSVGNDAFARQQLQDEEIARNEHFQLQELPLVAALMHPDSPIAENELIPSLLSEPEESLIPTMQIFDENQIAQIYNDAGAFLEQRDPAHMLTDAWRRLQIIEDHYRHQQPVSRAN
jgi:hypothetical protein